MVPQAKTGTRYYRYQIVSDSTTKHGEATSECVRPAVSLSERNTFGGVPAVSIVLTFFCLSTCTPSAFSGCFGFETTRVGSLDPWIRTARYMCEWILQCESSHWLSAPKRFTHIYMLILNGGLLKTARIETRKDTAHHNSLLLIVYCRYCTFIIARSSLEARGQRL